MAVVTQPDVPQRVELPDGHQIWLNGDSGMELKGDAETGWLVELDGEAFFSVVPGLGIPFRVVTDRLTVEVMGTQFKVSAYKQASDIEVGLVEGSVKITGVDGHRKPVVLEPNQVFSMDRGTSRFRVAEMVAVAAPEWRIENLDFEDTPLGEILRAAGIYFGKQMLIDPALELDEHFTMNFRKQVGLEDMLEILQDLSGEFAYRITGDTIELYPI